MSRTVIGFTGKENEKFDKKKYIYIYTFTWQENGITNSLENQ